MPLLIVNVKHASELVILFLTIFGVYFSIRERKLPFFHDQLKVYSYLVLAFFFSIVISVILSNNPIQGIHRIGSNIHFLVAPFVAYGIYKSNLDLKHIVNAIKLSIIVATVYAIYVHSAGRLEVNADSPTLYGFIMVLFGFTIIIDVWTQSKKEKLFSIFIFILAMYSVVLSGTRIAWVIFVVLFFSAILIWSIRGHLTKKGLLLILIALAIVTAFSMNNKSFTERIDEAFQEIKDYSVDSDSNGSVDLRLSMWSGGLTAFKQQPIIGYGYHNTGLAASRHVSGPYAKGFIKGQKMLHNDYVNSLVGFGILGLLALMALLFLPLTLFFKQLKADKECARSAIGVLFIIALSVFAITDSIYSHNVMRSFFVFFLGVLMPVARKEYV
ncbi:O-antigen ligase family protein [Candidatus Thioglobus sp.]|nr:O-antigen ligase family protein [Candidatus Thioglobus sp.]